MSWPDEDAIVERRRFAEFGFQLRERTVEDDAAEDERADFARTSQVPGRQEDERG